MIQKETASAYWDETIDKQANEKLDRLFLEDDRITRMFREDILTTLV